MDFGRILQRWGAGIVTSERIEEDLSSFLSEGEGQKVQTVAPDSTCEWNVMSMLSFGHERERELMQSDG